MQSIAILVGVYGIRYLFADGYYNCGNIIHDGAITSEYWRFDGDLHAWCSWYYLFVVEYYKCVEYYSCRSNN